MSPQFSNNVATTAAVCETIGIAVAPVASAAGIYAASIPAAIIQSSHLYVIWFLFTIFQMGCRAYIAEETMCREGVIRMVFSPHRPKKNFLYTPVRRIEN